MLTKLTGHIFFISNKFLQKQDLFLYYIKNSKAKILNDNIKKGKNYSLQPETCSQTSICAQNQKNLKEHFLLSFLALEALNQIQLSLSGFVKLFVGGTV